MENRTRKLARLERSTHKWIRDEWDEIDYFAVDASPHNGPECARCGFSFCWHCRVESPTPCPAK